MEALPTRADPHGQRAGQTLNPEQAIQLEEALRIFTQAGAKAIGREEQTGTLEVGKSADIIVLDRDLFTIPTADISNTEVLLTVFQGRPVHTAVPAQR
ncbi:amidohydrolase family protein [Kerstersia similis]|uniref:amidohydrolase family protein n=1 Tax=Kerstersia similis TaxID=206505 RepID=UPI0039EF8904